MTSKVKLIKGALKFFQRMNIRLEPIKTVLGIHLFFFSVLTDNLKLI